MLTFDEVMIAVPTRGTVRWETVTRLNEIRDEAPGMPPILYQPGNVSVVVTRNTIIEKFLESNCNTLLMVDDDIVPPVNVLDKLLPITTGFAVIGLPHPMARSEGAALAVFRDAGELFEPIWPAQGLSAVDAISTGCFAIHRRAFESCGSAPFRLGLTDDGQLLGEDVLLCRDLRSQGWKVGCYWDGEFAEHMQLAPLSTLLVATLERTMREMEAVNG